MTDTTQPHPEPQEASSLPVVAYLCKYGEIYQQPDDVLETDIPLIRLTDAQSQLSALRTQLQEQALQYLIDNGQWIEETGRLRTERDEALAACESNALHAEAMCRQRNEMKAFLQDPVLLHIAMLRGEVAKPAIRDMLHVYGEKALAQFDRGADEWHDRATEAQAERDAAREERDALKAAPAVDVEAIMVLVDKLLECQVDEDNCAHRGTVAEHDAATADRAAARSALRAALEARKT